MTAYLMGSRVDYACLFFFFQAEDGIRDVAVTGVQTCALPISSAPSSGGPFEWKIDVRNLELRGGSITVRPELGADATFALRDLNVTDAHARYEIGRASCRERV